MSLSPYLPDLLSALSTIRYKLSTQNFTQLLHQPLHIYKIYKITH